MQHRTLGTLPATPIGLGLAALGRPGYITLGHGDDLTSTDVAAMEAHAHAVLDAAWAAGIRYFDAARSYGKAEQFLGSWLRSREIAPDAVTVGSKWGYTYTANWQVHAEKHEVKEHSLDMLEGQWEESYQYLGKHLDLYQVHSATFSSGILENADVLNELANLKASGTTIGLTLSGPEQAQVLEDAVIIEVDGVRLFDVVQATWNLLERSVGAVLADVHQAGMGVLVKEVLANGRLTSRNTDPEFADQLKTLMQQAERLNTTVDALAIAAVLAQPWADVVLSGAARVDHLQSNVRALDVKWDAEAAAALIEIVEPASHYWRRRDALSWN